MVMGAGVFDSAGHSSIDLEEIDFVRSVIVLGLVLVQFLDYLILLLEKEWKRGPLMGWEVDWYRVEESLYFGYHDCWQQMLANDDLAHTLRQKLN